MFSIILITVLCIMVLYLVKKNLDLQEKANQLEFDKFMRGINSNLEGVKTDDVFSESIYKQRTIQ